MNMAVAAQRLVGLLFLVAGALKFTPQVEDVPAVLRRAAERNAGTGLASASRLFSVHHVAVQLLVACVMIGTGLVYLVNRGFVRLAALIQIAMLCTFSTFLVTSEGAVIVLVDASFVAFNVWLLVTHSRRARRAAGRGSTPRSPTELTHAKQGE